ncbi:MAG TPA: hypothetical protein VN030_07850 [Cellvibrio sp.]|nr:hypothetical protein [Cellvibrio sp.]
MLLKSSVGKKGVNHSSDVKLVQELLNRTLRTPFRLLGVDGIPGTKTQLAISNFQQKVVGLKMPDGLIEPHGKTWVHLQKYLQDSPNLQTADYRVFPNVEQKPFAVEHKSFKKDVVVISKNIAWGAKVSNAFKVKVVEICKYLDVAPDYLMSCMAFETGETFSPSIKNAAGSGATGLIQFMPSTAKSLGTTVIKLGEMTAVEQLEYVKMYFTPYKGKLKKLEDVYMAILYPAAISRSVDHVLFEAGTKAYDQNKGFDANKDGKITLQEISAKVRQKYEIGLRRGYLG